MNKNPDAILVSDTHIRESIPKCRLDNFVTKTQWEKLDFLSELQEKYNVPIINAGDLFHRAKNNNWLITETINHFPKNFYSIYGDHDFLYKTEKNVYQSSIETLRVAGKINIISNSLIGTLEIDTEKYL